MLLEGAGHAFLAINVRLNWLDKVLHYFLKLSKVANDVEPIERKYTIKVLFGLFH